MAAVLSYDIIAKTPKAQARKLGNRARSDQWLTSNDICFLSTIFSQDLKAQKLAQILFLSTAIIYETPYFSCREKSIHTYVYGTRLFCQCDWPLFTVSVAPSLGP